MQLSQAPNTDPPKHSLFVQRIQGWKPIPVPRPLGPSQKDCVYCQASREVQSAIWHAYGVEKDAQGSLRVAQDAGLVGVNVQSIRRHLANHNYEQPAPARRWRNEEMVQMGEKLKEREKQMLLAVYRQRVLLSRQLVDLFFEPETSNPTSATKSAYRFLHSLRFRHFLYQYRNRNNRSPEVYYFLGRYGAPWVEGQEGRIVGSPYVTNHGDINEYMMEHDTKAADVFVQLRRQLYTNRDPNNLVEVFGEKLPLHMSTLSWHGARSLSFLFHDPLANREARIIPDGFATLTVNSNSIQTQLPFFYEWDSGSKPAEETVEQMVNYVGFALSGAVGKRFPQLDAPQYLPPVVWVTSTPTRAYRLQKDAQAALARYGKESIPLMVITDARTLSAGGWEKDAWRVIHPSNVEGNLAELLLAGSKRWVDRGGLHPKVPLQVDLEAARPRAR